VKLKDAAFVKSHDAATQRRALLDRYVVAFRHVEAAALDQSKGALKDLAANISAWVVTDQQEALRTLVEAQLGRLA